MKMKEKNPTLYNQDRTMALVYLEDDNPSSFYLGKYEYYLLPLTKDELPIVGAKELNEKWIPKTIHLKEENSTQTLCYSIKRIKEVENWTKAFGYKVSDLQYHIPKSDVPLAIKLTENWWFFIAPRVIPE